MRTTGRQGAHSGHPCVAHRCGAHRCGGRQGRQEARHAAVVQRQQRRAGQCGQPVVGRDELLHPAPAVPAAVDVHGDQLGLMRGVRALHMAGQPLPVLTARGARRIAGLGTQELLAHAPPDPLHQGRRAVRAHPGAPRHVLGRQPVHLGEPEHLHPALRQLMEDLHERFEVRRLLCRAPAPRPGRQLPYGARQLGGDGVGAEPMPGTQPAPHAVVRLGHQVPGNPGVTGKSSGISAQTRIFGLVDTGVGGRVERCVTFGHGGTTPGVGASSMPPFCNSSARRPETLHGLASLNALCPLEKTLVTHVTSKAGALP